MRVKVKGKGRAHPGSEQAGQPGSRASGSSPTQFLLPPRNCSHLPSTLEAAGKSKGEERGSSRVRGEGGEKRKKEKVSGAREAIWDKIKDVSGRCKECSAL